MAVLVLAGWGAAERLSDDGSSSPAAPTSTPSPGETSTGAPYHGLGGPPPWVRYPTPLEGEWSTARLSGAVAAAIGGARRGERLTLVVRNAGLAVWTGTSARPERRILGREDLRLAGGTVLLHPVGRSREQAAYRWRIEDGVLTFRLLRRTAGADPSEPLATVPFTRTSS